MSRPASIGGSLPGWLMLASAAALLTGCAPAARPAPPASAVQAPAEWRTRLAAEGPMDRDWWKAFGDPRLVELVDQARANNPDLAIAAARVDEARAQEQLSRSLLLPGVNFAVPASRARSLSAFGRPTVGTTVQPVFQASYELDLFGRNRAQVAAAEAGLAGAEAAREAALLSVTASTASSYITLLALDDRLAVLRATLQARAEALRIARAGARSGYRSELELSQAEAEYRAAEQQIPVLQAAFARQENALALLTGALPRTVAPGRRLADLKKPAAPAVLPSELLRRRPDIAQAEFNLVASDARMRNARAQFLPQVTLSASAGSLIVWALDDPVTIWSVGGSLSGGGYGYYWAWGS